MYLNARKKGSAHPDPTDPPRRRGNNRRGHVTWDTDRPPVPGMFGRESGRLWLRMGRRRGAAELVDATVVPATEPGAVVNTDAWVGFKSLARHGRGHVTVNHEAGKYTRDDDGDGIREV